MVLATRHGVNLSGLNPGALVFIQMYRSLAGLESAMDVISTSSAYASLINDQKVQPYVRNIAKAADVPFDNAAAVDVKYLVFTRAERLSLSAQEMTKKWWPQRPFLQPMVRRVCDLVILLQVTLSVNICWASVINPWRLSNKPMTL
jgi:hypothetical protein